MASNSVNAKHLLNNFTVFPGESEFDGAIDITDDTQSISCTTGSLITSGGVGIQKNLNVCGITTINNTTDSSVSTDGALIVTGGVGIAKNLHVGESVDVATTKDYQVAGSSVLNATTLGSEVVTSSLSTVGALASGSIATGFGAIQTAGVVTLDNATSSISTSTGALIVTGGVGITENLNVAGESTVKALVDTDNGFFTVGNLALNKNNYDYSAIPAVFTSQVTTATLGDPEPVLSLSRTGVLGSILGANIDLSLYRYVNSAGASRTAIDFQFAHGFFMSGFTTPLTIKSGDIAGSSSDGTLIITGGMSVSNKVYIDDILETTGITTISNTTDSSVITDGALVVSGGVGIAKNLYVGGTIKIDDSTGGILQFRDDTASQIYQIEYNNQGGNGSANDLRIVGADDGAQRFIDIGHYTSDLSANAWNSTWKVGSESGILTSIGINNITNTTDSTGSTDGALIVTGGVGIAKKLFVGSDLGITGSITMTNEFIRNGGTVTQATDINTQVSLNNAHGIITTVSSTIASSSSETFILNNTTLASSRNCKVGIDEYTGAGFPYPFISKICDIADLGFADLGVAPAGGVTELSFTALHGLITGQKITITGHTQGTLTNDINGTHIVDVQSTTVFRIPIAQSGGVGAADDGTFIPIGSVEITLANTHGSAALNSTVGLFYEVYDN